MRAILDVGANDGSWGITLAKRCPDVKVYGFEPTPRLCDRIRASIEDEGVENYELIPKAVCDVEGTAQFNVAGVGDWGSSSLLDFSDNLEKTWPGRTDFQVTEAITVDMIRLDRFVEDNGIQRIDFLHCDTQGTDLRVLASLGRHLPIVCRGLIEAATSKSVALYKNQHTLEDVVLFFLQHNLKIERLIPNDRFFNEVNVLFRPRS